MCLYLYVPLGAIPCAMCSASNSPPAFPFPFLFIYIKKKSRHPYSESPLYMYDMAVINIVIHANLIPEFVVVELS